MWSFVKAFLVQYWPAILAALLFGLSEILGATKRVKANGVVELLINIVMRIFRGRPGVDEVAAAFGKDAQLPAGRAPTTDVAKTQWTDTLKILALFFVAIACSSCSSAQWQSYLAKGGTCEMQAAAAALGSGATGLLSDIEATIAGQPAFSPDAWAARALTGLTSAAFSEVQCRAAHLLGDLAQRTARTDGVRVASSTMRWWGICHSVQERHRPYLEALLRVRR